MTIGDEDITYALGVTPVGIVRNTQNDSGVAAWPKGRVDPVETAFIDVVVMLYATDDLQRQVEELELFGNLRGVRDGWYIVIDLPTATALRSPTVLSIPWALDQIRPSLARVATP